MTAYTHEDEFSISDEMCRKLIKSSRLDCCYTSGEASCAKRGSLF